MIRTSFTNYYKVMITVESYKKTKKGTLELYTKHKYPNMTAATKACQAIAYLGYVTKIV